MDKADKELLRVNRLYLLDNVDPNEKLLAALGGTTPTIITDLIRQEIEALPTIDKKNGYLLDTLARRGPTAFRVFMESLVLTEQGFIVEELLGNKCTDYIMTPSGRQHGYPVQAQSDPHKEWTLDDIPNCQDNLIPVYKLLKKVSPNDSRIRHKGVYKMTSHMRGLCLIFHNRSFDKATGLIERDGDEFDFVNLSELFTNLGFKVEDFLNLTAEEMKETAMRCATNAITSQHDALVVIIMSHGKKDEVLGIDGVGVNVDELVSYFDGEGCPQLIGKPKIFLIQACQGSEQTTGHKGLISSLSQHHPTEDESDIDTNVSKETVDAAKITPSMEKLLYTRDAAPVVSQSATEPHHEKNDIIVSMSTVDGYKSWRNTAEGSWFIRSIVEVFCACAYDGDLLSMLQLVRWRLSNKKTGEGMLQASTDRTNTLLKKVYFFPGYSDN